jgi:RNase P protein component
MASLVVPKSVAKSSVARNRLRRRGYAVLEKYLKQHPIKLLGVFVFGRGSQEFFSGRKKAGYDPVDNMTREITALLSKAEKLL